MMPLSLSPDCYHLLLFRHIFRHCRRRHDADLRCCHAFPFSMFLRAAAIADYILMLMIATDFRYVVFAMPLAAFRHFSFSPFSPLRRFHRYFIV